MRRRNAIGRMMGCADASAGWDQIPPDAILARPAGDLRPPIPEHVISMAETIAAIGLLHPVVVDAERRLLAGRHRVEAFRLLAITDADARVRALCSLAGHPDVDPDRVGAGLRDVCDRCRSLDIDGFARFHPDGAVPVRIRADLDAERDPDAAHKAEIAENDVRRDFTRAQILTYTEHLRAAGYHDTPGRPKAGDKALIPTLVGIVGKSRRTILRILAEERAPSAPPVDERARARADLNRAIDRFRRRSSEAAEAPLAPLLEHLQDLLATRAREGTDS